MSRCDYRILWHRCLTFLSRIFTSVAESAADSDIDQAARIAAHDLFLSVTKIRVKNRRCVKQSSCVRMLCMFRDFKGWSEFHQTSQIHDSDFIANVLDDVQIVSDYQIGQIQLFLQVKQQVENLCLYGYVKGTGRLIESSLLDSVPALLR